MWCRDKQQLLSILEWSRYRYFSTMDLCTSPGYPLPLTFALPPAAPSNIGLWRKNVAFPAEGEPFGKVHGSGVTGLKVHLSVVWMLASKHGVPPTVFSVFGYIW